MVDEEERHDDSCDRTAREAERRPLVVVERGQGARYETAEDLCDRGGDDPRQQLGGVRLSRGVRREHRRDRVRPGDRHDHDKRKRCRERNGPGSDLRAQPTGGTGGHEPRQDDHPQRARDKHQPQIDAVGGEETVRLYAMPKLARQNHTQHRSGAADRCRGDPRQKAAAHSSLTC